MGRRRRRGEEGLGQSTGSRQDRGSDAKKENGFYAEKAWTVFHIGKAH